MLSLEEANEAIAFEKRHCPTGQVRCNTDNLVLVVPSKCRASVCTIPNGPQKRAQPTDWQELESRNVPFLQQIRAKQVVIINILCFRVFFVFFCRRFRVDQSLFLFNSKFSEIRSSIVVLCIFQKWKQIIFRCERVLDSSKWVRIDWFLFRSIQCWRPCHRQNEIVPRQQVQISVALAKVNRCKIP